MPLFKVKAANRFETPVDENNITVPSDYAYEDLNDAAMFYGHSYQTIFGKKRSESTAAKKRLAIVKIRKGKRVIHRRFLAEPMKGIGQNELALTPASIRELAIHSNSDVVGHEVEVSKGCWFCYYWNHPFHATRISFRLGFPALVISIMSLIASIIAIGLSCCI